MIETINKLNRISRQMLQEMGRERIRQTDAKALWKLRHPSRGEQFRNFLIKDRF
jgi:DNA-directed RNA polymerase sigma subunit (sigma70/sigma32)